MLVNYSNYLCIPDGVAAYHIEGKTCLPLTPLSGSSGKFSHGGKTGLPLTSLSGYSVKFAHVTGFDEEATENLGLPIVPVFLKRVNTKDKEILVKQSTYFPMLFIHTTSCPLTKCMNLELLL